MGVVTLMTFAAACFAAMGQCIKALGMSLPTAQAVCFRCGLGLPIMWGIARHQNISLRPTRFRYLLIRSGLGITAVFCHFYAIQHGKLAEITMMGLSQPILVALLARVFLKEPSPSAVRVALIGTTLGALLLTRPGALGMNLVTLVAFGATLLSSAAHMSLRRVSLDEHPLCIVFWFYLFSTVCSGILAAPVYQTPQLRQALLLFGGALGASGGQILMTTAYSKAPAPMVAAVSNVQLIFVLMFDWLIYRSLPTLTAFAGGIIIMVSAGYLAWAKQSRTN